ncbi:MAG: periplasmic heavy metal sensor [Deltaproteobacteria bacterium]
MGKAKVKGVLRVHFNNVKYLWWYIMRKTKIIPWLSTFLLVFATSFAFSQPPGTKSSMGAGMRQWRGENRCWKASDLNLSSDQLKGLELINQAYLKETRPLRNELFSKRLELREFLTNPSIKAESIQMKTSEVLALESKIGEREIEYLMKVRSLLTQEQLKNWCPEQEFSSLRGMMQRPEFMGPVHPRKTPPQERPREE